MLLEICMQIYSVVFALSRQINNQKVCENTYSPCEGNKVFVKYQAQGRVLTPTPPCVRPCCICFIEYLVSIIYVLPCSDTG